MRETSIDHLGARACRNRVGRLLFVVAVAGVLVAAFTTVGRADAPTPLGGLDLGTYCQSLGYDGTIMTKPQLGPNAAYDNWRCFTGTSTAPTSLHPFSIEQACKFQYRQNAIQTHPTNPDDGFTWVCYSVAHA
jgi:hypothetical protein